MHPEPETEEEYAMTPKLIVLSLALALVAVVTFAVPAGEEAAAGEKDAP